MSKHTPGPWEVGKRKNIYAAVSTNSHEMELLKKSGKDKFEALSVGNNAGQIAIIPLDDSNEANACLIAAAPELLEALKEMLKIHDHEHPDCFCCECRYAKQAIAKAEGKWVI